MSPASVSAPSASPRPPRRRLWLWILGTVGALLLGASYAVASLFWLDHDAGVVRDQLLSAHGGGFRTRVQFNLGWGTTSLVRALVGHLEGVDDEARVALSALRAVSVGVYHLNRTAVTATPDLATLDARMSGRGWSRVALVRKPHATVLVYVQNDCSSHGPVRVCVAVCQERELVVVAARGDLDPLLDLAKHQLTDHLAGGQTI